MIILYMNCNFFLLRICVNCVNMQLNKLCSLCVARYNYANAPNSWIHDGSDAAFKSCFPTSTSEINKLILNTHTLNTSTLNTFANSTITFRVQRPAKKQLNAEEVLVIGGLNPPLNESHFLINAFLYFPTANVNTSITCPQFFGKLGNSAVMFGDTVPNSKKEWRIALTTKLQSLNLDHFSHVVVTLVEASGSFPQYLQLPLTAKIVYFDY